MSKLQNGLIPARTECQFRAKCKAQTCAHAITEYASRCTKAVYPNCGARGCGVEQIDKDMMKINLLADKRNYKKKSEIHYIDYLGQAFDLEECAKKTTSQTEERAMLSAARTLRRVLVFFSS